ncbi:carbamoyltransferase HypF [Vulcanococcus limneticus]|uniref:carbamoyltransferase HypF n=1 Tax=Vulcanococcus limneticus TaxID=2170428 RepID=UPI00398C01A0
MDGVRRVGQAAPQRLELQLEGLVQGVGFRPWVHRLATGLGLRGWVANGPDGAALALEGDHPALEAFLAALPEAKPAHCRIDRVVIRWGTSQGEPAGMRIAPSTAMAPASADGAAGGSAPAARALVLPDLATCAACLAELRDPGNRRHGYPLISCTDCGPRYSVLRRLPFEREHTSLADFPLCAACRHEYGDPADRRFHAQTLSCPACGPRLAWLDLGRSSASAGGADSEHGIQLGPGAAATNRAAIAAAAAALRAGRIVALQGVGGFQLLVDAGNALAVAELRRRKGRPDKPLALMAPRQWIEAHGRPSPEETALLDSAAAPIVLLRQRTPAPIAAAVTRGSAWLGVMRPTSALHHLLLESFGGPVVATSANRSGEPLASDATADGAVLAALADGVLSHGLAIVNPIDDGVARVAGGQPLLLRQGRGHAPIALDLPEGSAAGRTGAGAGAMLALGAQLKASFALGLPAEGGRSLALLSPALGDLESEAGAAHLQHTLLTWLDRHGIRPAALRCDGHPGYVSTRLAQALAVRDGLPLRPVQHHHAHLLACVAEHDLAGPQLGVAWDGSGHGDDGTLWGGEALLVTPSGYRRLARLRPFRLPGGEAAPREPRRAALGLLHAGLGAAGLVALQNREDLASLAAFTPEELTVLSALLESTSATAAAVAPLCSSVGRLFDAVASLLGLVQRCSYEGQAAMALEGLATAAWEREGDAGAGGRGRFAAPRDAIPIQRGNQHRDQRGGQHRDEWGDQTDEPWELDWLPLLEGILQDLANGRDTGAIALHFHRALASALGELASALGARQLLLAGGCFQNALLLELACAELHWRGITPLWPRRLPCNDGAVALGQLLAEGPEPSEGTQ